LTSPDGGKTIVPTLNIDSELLVDPYTSNEFKQLVLYHEYQHYLQWKTKRYPARMYMGWLTTESMTEKQVIDFYHGEVEAYLAECELANYLGWTKEFELCSVIQYGDMVSFRLSIVDGLLLDPKVKEHKARVTALAKSGH
jgi:hypothetical protein